MAETGPFCGASMQGELIDPKHHEHAHDCPKLSGAERCFCLPYGDATHFSRVIGHEIPGVYDGTLFWSCPDCRHAWPRFVMRNRLSNASADAARDWNAEVMAS